eukprot:CAMPEP_0182920804 /NCGR_PEP_ID=MMETSP0105_2-20130417/3727_1 /TAXON_ID=81532 ORGANISM="Acanthoeca-like sp., Strain 10tr" /NCGR_SAMPLE_ID=MMETSP0105_2 /ASSEMBLY_ACC=CAM_ASM_000205 /LENGTH=130 /DNA_ID=CAMNT_0025058257 /DNA_START=11 /DNA_END=400 /DNA_ORIENTATION=+
MPRLAPKVPHAVHRAVVLPHRVVKLNATPLVRGSIPFHQPNKSQHPATRVPRHSDGLSDVLWSNGWLCWRRITRLTVAAVRPRGVEAGSKPKSLVRAFRWHADVVLLGRHVKVSGASSRRRHLAAPRFAN